MASLRRPANATRRARERIVGSSISSRSVTRIITTLSGGSSSVFSSAFCVVSFIESAELVISTRYLPSYAERLTSFQPPHRRCGCRAYPFAVSCLTATVTYNAAE
jgi:hypothetical protein